MAPLTETRVREILGGIVDPHTGVALTEGGAIHAVGVDGDRAHCCRKDQNRYG